MGEETKRLTNSSDSRIRTASRDHDVRSVERSSGGELTLSKTSDSGEGGESVSFVGGCDELLEGGKRMKRETRQFEFRRDGDLETKVDGAHSLPQVILLLDVLHLGSRRSVEHSDGLSRRGERNISRVSSQPLPSLPFSRMSRTVNLVLTIENTVYPSPRSLIASSITSCSGVDFSFRASWRSFIPSACQRSNPKPKCQLPL